MADYILRYHVLVNIHICIKIEPESDFQRLPGRSSNIVLTYGNYSIKINNYLKVGF